MVRATCRLNWRVRACSPVSIRLRTTRRKARLASCTSDRPSTVMLDVVNVLSFSLRVDVLHSLSLLRGQS